MAHAPLEFSGIHASSSTTGLSQTPILELSRAPSYVNTVIPHTFLFSKSVLTSAPLPLGRSQWQETVTEVPCRK